MKRTYLSEDEKHIIFTLQDSPNYQAEREQFRLSDREFDMAIRTLISRTVVRSSSETHEKGFLSCELTEKGLLYLQSNPTLENPKTEEEIAKEQLKLRREDRLWSLVQITFGTILGAIIAYFTSK